MNRKDCEAAATSRPAENLRMGLAGKYFGQENSRLTPQGIPPTFRAHRAGTG